LCRRANFGGHLVAAGLSLLLVSDVVSDGLALSGVCEVVAGGILRKADRALYGAKREGKGGYTVATPSPELIAGRE